MKKRHECNAGSHKTWPMCVVCDGRLHLPGCTSERNPHKDCCFKRHLKLYKAGQHYGIYDASLHMLEGYEEYL